MPSRKSLSSALGARRAVVALGVLTILVVVWAAAIPRPTPVIPTLRPTYQVRQIGADDEMPGGQGDFERGVRGSSGARTSDAVAAVLGWSAVALVVIAALACLLVLWRAWRRSQEPRTPEESDAPDLDLEALAVAVTADAAQRSTALSAGTPAEGIIAAWTHLEATLHEAGVRLAASRTSTEVALEVLHRFAVDRETLAVLALLYREARWSRHPLTEADRARAAESYRSLDADLRAQATGTRSVPSPRGARG